MDRLEEIPINIFQLNILLDENEKDGFEYIKNNNVYCVTCKKMCVKGIEIKEMYLTSLNDIKICGICNKCKNKVTRILEFGENKRFFNNANKFRKSIQ
ncbi:MAG: hypothetical protein A2275_08990 [Bacteroidetes bacterium RIFOXYA12_FULL_35_11]|nr:MAG: hypothetical protein A2X01_06115 [Bacteroidetes bacterium GWF2_35_48]OFY82936.1 MAG: hypothetical protein A2275_08990 [Bacteroidetes bacterium RIFOXYA12_FULL_35_11]OFY95270.1 MAG: hypothetical protein A2309_03100 [Bacteroidetes bacterium RIFOXYB2_FULL_35_7]OFZ01890.1 MAG: hypothetical protein A2491_02450 [Bacteroidetes bacterium RIFOXYC12_FULL_35_7]HBX52752.1 hypothetical protein [Bacteroidales bacterium]